MTYSLLFSGGGVVGVGCRGVGARFMSFFVFVGWLSSPPPSAHQRTRAEYGMGLMLRCVCFVVGGVDGVGDGFGVGSGDGVFVVVVAVAGV